MSQPIIVLTTVGSEEQAISIAEELVDKHLSACVNIIPAVRSIYRWRGEICNDEELLLVIKTIPELFEPIRATIRELHSYELPECISISIDRGCPNYLEWLVQTIRETSDVDPAADES